MKKRKPLVRGLLQIIPVMIGVFLGLVANNWNENRKINKDKEALTELLSMELNENLKELQEVYNYHKNVQDSFALVFNEVGEIPADRLSTFWYGMRPPKLKRSCFESAIITGLLNKFEVNAINHLNETYLQQTNIDKYFDKALSSFLNLDMDQLDKTRPMIRKITMILGDVIQSESMLIEKLEETITSLEQ